LIRVTVVSAVIFTSAGRKSKFASSTLAVVSPALMPGVAPFLIVEENWWLNVQHVSQGKRRTNGFRGRGAAMEHCDMGSVPCFSTMELHRGMDNVNLATMPAAERARLCASSRNQIRTRASTSTASR